MSGVKEALGKRAAELELTLGDDAWGRLEVLCDLWLRYGKVMNLTGASTREQLYDHLEDGLGTVACASKLMKLEVEVRWLDVGSGGGFPGLIVAACTPVQLTLVEPRVKRARFLELAVATIQRAGVGVFAARLEDVTWPENIGKSEAGADRREFDVASARAVWEPAEWLKVGSDRVKSDGFVLAHLAHSANELGIACPRAVVAGRLGKIAAYARI